VPCPSPTCTTSPPLPDRTAGKPGPTPSPSTCCSSQPGDACAPLRAQGEPARAAWTWFAVALAASLGANVATAGLLDLNDVPDWLRILVAGWPALAFLGGTLLVHSPTTTTTTDAEPVEPEPLPVVEPVTVPAEPDPEPDVLEPAPEPVPALPAAPAPADVPPALVDHARKLADAHRATTGSPIDAATLRDRLGLPGPMADQLAAHLA
jgi:hypothetical protein